MKRTLPLIPLLMAAVLIAAPFSDTQASDGFASGTNLKDWCDNLERNDIHWGLCVGSITAAHDMVMTYQAADVALQVVCTDMTTTRGDVVVSVIDYLHEHPNELDYSLGDVVLSALVEKFPCD